MLYMKEDDMDEMIRKAAENYEVDSKKAADWNFVYKAVHEPEETESPEKKKRKDRFIFWWLFLIPLGWIAHTEYSKFKGTQQQAENKTPSVIEKKITDPQQPAAENFASSNNANGKKNPVAGSNQI